MKALITGISGFAGSFLAELLLENGYDVHGTHVSDNVNNINSIKKSIQLKKLNLLNKQDVEHYIFSTPFDVIFHLAALTSPAESFNEPFKVFANNISGQINLLEAVRLSSFSPRILITSSAEVYGLVQDKDLPIDEKTELRPASPYAVSKIAQDYLGFQYFLSFGMDIVRVRPFNHVGPRQSSQFVVASFAQQIAQIEKNHGEKTLKVGNLEAKRDFTDVRDMVRAYLQLSEKGKAGDVYNIGSGKSHKISEILDMLLSYSDEHITIEVDPGRMRPSDVSNIRANNRKIEDETSWKPEVSLEKTLLDTLNYWRQESLPPIKSEV